jgi:hypothetical protein
LGNETEYRIVKPGKMLKRKLQRPGIRSGEKGGRGRKRARERTWID